MDMSKAARTTAQIIAQSEAAQDLQIKINDLTESLRHAQGDAEYYAERRLNATTKSTITRFYNKAMEFQAEAARLESELAAAKADLSALIREERAAMMPTDQQNMRAAAGHVIDTYEKIDLRPYDGVSEAITNVYRKGPITIYISESAIEGGEIIEFLIERSDRAHVGTVDGTWYEYYRGSHERGNWRRDLTPDEQAHEADLAFGRRWAKLAERSAVAPAYSNMPEAEAAPARAAHLWDLFSEEFAALPWDRQQEIISARSQRACEGYKGWEHDRDLDPDRCESDEYRDPDQDQWDREEAERAAMDGGYTRAFADAMATISRRNAHAMARNRRQIARAGRRLRLAGVESRIVAIHCDDTIIDIHAPSLKHPLCVEQMRDMRGTLLPAEMSGAQLIDVATPATLAAGRLAFKLASIKTAQAKAAAQAGRRPSKVYILYSKKSQAARAALRNRFAR